MPRRLLAAVTCAVIVVAPLSASGATGKRDGEARERPARIERAIPHAELSIRPRAIIIGESARATGRVGTYRHPVTLQRRTGTGAWVKVAAKRTDRYGYFGFEVTPTKRGATSYRIRTTKWDVRGPVYSRVRTLDVQGPLEGPFYLASGDNAVLRREVRGLERSRPLYRIPGLASVLTARDGSGRVLYSRWDGGREVLGVRGGDLPDLEPVGTIPGNRCGGWTALSPDGRYLTFGSGTVDGIFCLPPDHVTLVDTLTGERRQVASPGDGSFASMHDPQFTADGSYLLMSGFVDFFERTRVVDLATGEVVEASGESTHEGYRPTTLTTADGAVVLRSGYDFVAEDCATSLVAVLPGSTQPAYCWGEGVFTADEAIHVVPSPDLTRLAWLTGPAGDQRFMVAPASDPASAKDLGGLGYTPDGNRQFLTWLSNDVLAAVDNAGTGKSITRDAVTGANLGPWPRRVLGWLR